MRAPFQTIERMCSGMKVSLEERQAALCAVRRIELLVKAGHFHGQVAVAALFDAELNLSIPIIPR